MGAALTMVEELGELSAQELLQIIDENDRLDEEEVINFATKLAKTVSRRRAGNEETADKAVDLGTIFGLERPYKLRHLDDADVQNALVAAIAWYCTRPFTVKDS